MRKKLHRLYLVSSALMLIVAVLAVGMMVRMKVEDTRQNLRSILSASSAWTMQSAEDFQSLAEEIAKSASPIRVTFLLRSGIVLADSEVSSSEMENHLTRPEVQDALRGGVGESLRMSDTQDMLVMYTATQLSDILILRLSYPLDGMVRMVIGYAALLAVLFAALYLYVRRALSRYARDMVGQIEEIRSLLEGNAEEVKAVFPEFQPALNQIAYQVHRLGSDMKEITRTLSLRSDFVANASHELRSPLTSIMGFAEMIDEGLADTPEEREMCIRMIRSECERMLEVISDILQLSKAENQPAELAPIDAAALAGEVAKALAPQAARKDIALHVHGSAVVMAQEKDLWEILYNLADNAVRYGKDGGRVDILLDGGCIRVRDDGVGVSAEHLPHLFEQFYRVDDTRGMAAGGTGLGLSIVRALVERCGGAISVESELGIGTEFTVLLNVPEGDEA